MPMELEWTTELGKLFHKDISYMGGKGKGVHAIGRTKVRSCTCLDETSCTLHVRVAVGATTNPCTWLYKEHNFNCFCMQPCKVGILRSSSIVKYN